ncbi:uncharacterized protein N7482_000690 [Penicillium canariense]|uniref:Uncharacterized protein n=1 Tax=Penicillium canariense TaxID=189055 RepID=A0A9W9LS78_9EURO|nr:uncharacterized protein N7482_000690 [Penicillium canariense]KAJ5174813.1 hypothetical protein N7482_000690 [Penicillium canariense]
MALAANEAGLPITSRVNSICRAEAEVSTNEDGGGRKQKVADRDSMAVNSGPIRRVAGLRPDQTRRATRPAQTRLIDLCKVMTLSEARPDGSTAMNPALAAALGRRRRQYEAPPSSLSSFPSMGRATTEDSNQVRFHAA